MRIALATCTELLHLDADEAPLVAALTARGVDVVTPVWNQGDAPFLAADLTVIRNTWDYSMHVDAFVAWARRIEAGGALHNPASVVQHNTHKRYLLQLHDAGIPVVPTVLTSAGGVLDVEATLRARGWTHGAVVKPAVSAGSKDTVRIHALSCVDAQALVDVLLPTRDMLLQPFVEGIVGGEISVHYIDGHYSHTVSKVPMAGEFRSQPEFGSHVTAIEPSARMLHVADAALRLMQGNLLYARVDLVAAAHSDGCWLMELELVEPSMYLRWAPHAAVRFADAIIARALTRRR